MPCSPGTFKNNVVFPEHPASRMEKKAGDLVSHDIIECYLCRNATGCVQLHKNSGGSSSFDANGSARLSLKETESDESCLSEANPEIEITQTILHETTGLGAGEHNTFFPT